MIGRKKEQIGEKQPISNQGNETPAKIGVKMH